MPSDILGSEILDETSHFKFIKGPIFSNIILADEINIEGRNITSGNIGGHQYTGRVEFLPFGNFTSGGDYSGSDLKREQTPKLALGVSYDHNNNAVKNRSNQGSYMFINGTSAGSSAEFYQTNISTVFISDTKITELLSQLFF